MKHRPLHLAMTVIAVAASADTVVYAQQSTTSGTGQNMSTTPLQTPADAKRAGDPQTRKAKEMQFQALQEAQHMESRKFQTMTNASSARPAAAASAPPVKNMK